MAKEEKDLIEDYKNRISELEAELETAKRAQIALDASGFDIWENNFVTGEAQNSNEKLFAELGYIGKDRPDDLDTIFSLIHPDDYAPAMEAVEAHFRGETNRYKAEFRLKAFNGDWVWMGNYGQVVERNDKNEVTKFIGVSFNIDQRRVMEEAMKAMAYSDPLTGLGNRRMLFERADEELSRAFRYKHDLSIMIADIDYFKKINDSYGHTIGDQVLAAYADALQRDFRHVDMKIRYGGDEFIVLMPETNLDQAIESAQRFNYLISKLSTPVEEGITTSIGVAEIEAEESIESLIKRADKALYKAKDMGRNTVAFY